MTIDFPTETITEGKARLVVPKLKAYFKSPSEYLPSKAPVFYNPIMELNRDLAIIALQTYQRMLGREISVCEPLAGCGVRGVRSALEVEGVRKVLVNDINKKASKLANHNVQINGLQQRIAVKNEDANCLLARYAAPKQRFDAIDIDPFGSPVPYLDSAIRALRDRGLIALTATDLASLCGVYPKACIRKYGGKPLRTEYCHELAIRLLAGCLAATAAKHDIGIKIVFSHSTDHYIRVYATAKYGAKVADETLKNMGYILHCFKCFHREIIPTVVGHSMNCAECNSKLATSGPLWIGKIFDKKFCDSMLREVEQRNFKQKDRIIKLLTLIKLEAEAPPTYYVIDAICDSLELSVPSVRKVVEALEKADFRAFKTHFNTKGMRTDAPSRTVKEVIKNLAC